MTLSTLNALSTQNAIFLLQEELDEVLRGRDRGARTDQSAEGRRKEHQSELTKKMNQEARVSHHCAAGSRRIQTYTHTHLSSLLGIVRVVVKL